MLQNSHKNDRIVNANPIKQPLCSRCFDLLQEHHRINSLTHLVLVFMTLIIYKMYIRKLSKLLYCLQCSLLCAS